MRINKEIQPYIDELIDIKATNIDVADIYIYLFSQGSLISKNDVNILKEQGLNSNQIIFTAMSDLLEIDFQDDNNKELFDKILLPGMHKCDTKEFVNNPYFKAVNIGDVSKGRYHLRKDTYEPFQLFPLDDITVLSDYSEVSNVGYFETRYSFLTLFDKNDIWMSLNPNEIITMKKPIEEAKGNMLVVGLGLGYFAYMASIKDDVKSVTIIEKDPNIISLFNENILPCFKNKDKIKIINDDALKYLDKLGNSSNFDGVFFDIWHDPEDGVILYEKLLKYEDKLNCPTSYWIESSLLAMARRCLITLLEENKEGFADKDYQKAQNDMDRLINSLYFKCKNITLNNVDEVREFLSDKSIRELLKR